MRTYYSTITIVADIFLPATLRRGLHVADVCDGSNIVSFTILDDAEPWGILNVSE